MKFEGQLAWRDAAHMS